MFAGDQHASAEPVDLAGLAFVVHDAPNWLFLSAGAQALVLPPLGQNRPGDGQYFRLLFHIRVEDHLVFGLGGLNAEAFGQPLVNRRVGPASLGVLPPPVGMDGAPAEAGRPNVTTRRIARISRFISLSRYGSG